MHAVKAPPSSPAAQVHLVMEYCDLGTLHSALKAGKFHDADGQPRLRAVLLTALDVARGLQYLHNQERRIVHRDLSSTNVLLTSTPHDERGFVARLSDFGARHACTGSSRLWEAQSPASALCSCALSLQASARCWSRAKPT